MRKGEQMKEIDKKKTGKLIVRTAEVLGYSKNALAKALDVSPQLVGYWEEGRNLPRIETFIRICELFQCNIEELIVCEDS